MNIKLGKISVAVERIQSIKPYFPQYGKTTFEYLTDNGQTATVTLPSEKAYPIELKIRKHLK